jgi:hypothetical protein
MPGVGIAILEERKMHRSLFSKINKATCVEI